MRDIYLLILGSLVVWRVTHLLNAEDGPWKILVRLRKLLSRIGLAGLVDCFYCLSLWLAAPVAWLLEAKLQRGVMLWLALSAGAILAERLTKPHEPLAPVAYFQEGEIER